MMKNSLFLYHQKFGTLLKNFLWKKKESGEYEKMKKILIFLSESLQSSSLDSEAFQLFKSVTNDDDIQIPDLEKKISEENGLLY